MNITLEKLQFTDFEDNTQSFILVALESKTPNNYDRSFICFNENSEVNLIELLPLLTKNEMAIHSSKGSLDNIVKVLQLNTIKITAFTQKYWSDVKLFIQHSSSDYVQDVFNTSIMENLLLDFIKNKFYNKEKLVQYALLNNKMKMIKILQQSKFIFNDLKDVFEEHPHVQHVFDLNNLSELLNNNLFSKGTNFKLVKV